MNRFVKIVSRAGLTFLVVAALMLPLMNQEPLKAQAADRPDSFADLAEKVAPSVVNIRIVKTIKSQGTGNFFRFHRRSPQDDQNDGLGDPYEFFRRFFGPNQPGQDPRPREFKQRSLGSGVIVGRDGFVITNNHVVANADQIVVKMKNGKEYEAEVKGRDPKTDLALIKVKADEDLPYLPLGDSSKLRVGDWVIAVGNPFGLENTVTAGIVSAKGRAIGAGVYDDFIQTDASINPGNSGGPLINLKGEVVGINTAIVPQGQGIGFAIPVNLAKKIMAQLRESGKVVRGYFGVIPQELDEKLAEQFNMKEPEGALVSFVEKDSPADKAGIKRGDVIIEVDGKAIPAPGTLYKVVADLIVGEEVTVKVIRGGDTKELTIKVAARPDEEAKKPEEPKKEVRLGMTLQNLTPDLARQLGLKEAKGVVVTGVERGSPAAEAGLMRGDVILEAAHQPVNTIDDFYSQADKLKEGEGLLLLVQRREVTQYLVLKLPE
jgi:serine protease Do